ncbi:MAG: TrbJ/VirB5 family protein [Steroidobacteraceae bacterium]
MQPTSTDKRSRLAFAGPVLALLALAISRPAAAQWAVIDVGAIQQLVQQYAVLEQQLTTLRSQLSQAQQQYAALTGGRGMQQLLSGINRNYLPASWADLAGVMQGSSGSYGTLAASVQGLITANAVLSSQDVASLSPTEQAQLTDERELPALLQGITRQALSAASDRFASLQQLISAIPTATDAKAALDLNARIAAEQAMLQNETTKLQVLYRTVAAQQWALDQQRREQAIADIGSLRTLPPMGLQ